MLETLLVLETAQQPYLGLQSFNGYLKITSQVMQRVGKRRLGAESQCKAIGKGRLGAESWCRAIGNGRLSAESWCTGRG